MTEIQNLITEENCQVIDLDLCINYLQDIIVEKDIAHRKLKNTVYAYNTQIQDLSYHTRCLERKIFEKDKRIKELEIKLEKQIELTQKHQK